MRILVFSHNEHKTQWYRGFYAFFVKNRRFWMCYSENTKETAKFNDTMDKPVSRVNPFCSLLKRRLT